MFYKHSAWFLGLSVLIVVAVWSQLDGVEFNRLSQDWSSEVGGRRLDASGVLGFLALWGLALWARSRRYQCLSAVAGVPMAWRDAFESVTLGRFFTLITPTALLGGQPISYFRLATRYPARVAAGVVTVATWLDIAFFIVTTPIVLWRVIFVLQFENRYATLITLTFLIYALILGAFWLALSPWADAVIRLAARVWSTLVPFWQRATLTRTFTHAAQHLRTYLDALRAGRREAWMALGHTAVAILCPYMGIWWLLWSMGCDMGFIDSMGNQLAINFMALAFSPGAGSGTSEFMFIRMFDQWVGQPGLIHLAIFMTASYWSYIALGLGVWLSWRPEGTVLTLEVEPALLREYPQALTVRVVDEGDARRQWGGALDPAGEYSVFLPKDLECRWELCTPAGPLVQGRVTDSPLIKRVFIGARPDSR